MHRQYSRNQRNRGYKVKHVVQICLFLAICCWLIYQMKHSHDKKDEFEDDDVRDSMERGSIGGYIKIGRKDIRPLYVEDKLQNDESEEEITEDRSLDKNAEEENEASSYEDVVEKFDTEVDQEEEKESDEGREAGSDTEAEGEASDDGNGRKQENSDKSNHEAREESYEANDGSSAVKEVVGIFNQPHSEEARNGETSNEDNPSTVLNVTLTEAPNSKLEASNSTTDAMPKNPELFEPSVPELQGILSEGKSMVGSIFKIISLHQNSSTLTVENHLSESNSTGHTEPKNSEADFEDFLKPYNDTYSLPIVRLSRSEHSFEDKTNSQKN